MSPLHKLDEVRRLEELAFRGWPALESQNHNGWHLRFSGGYTKRSNSINAISEDASTDIEDLEAPYRARGQRPAWRLSPLAPPAMVGLLEARGYSNIERSLVQRCPLHDGFTADPAVEIGPQPTPAWIEAFCAHSPVRPEHRETMERMLAAIATPKGFALVQSNGRPMAMAIGAVEGDHMGLFDVLVMPEARRQGLWPVVSPRASMPGPGNAVPASPTCRSSPRMPRPCLSTKRRVSARSTPTAIGCRRRDILALTLQPPPSHSRCREEHKEWPTILGKRAIRRV